MAYDVTTSIPAVTSPVKYIRFPNLATALACIQMYIESGYRTQYSRNGETVDESILRRDYASNFLLGIGKDTVFFVERRRVPETLITPFSAWFKYQITALLSDDGEALVEATKLRVAREVELND